MNKDLNKTKQILLMLKQNWIHALLCSLYDDDYSRKYNDDKDDDDDNTNAADGYIYIFFIYIILRI